MIKAISKVTKLYWIKGISKERDKKICKASKNGHIKTRVSPEKLI